MVSFILILLWLIPFITMIALIVYGFKQPDPSVFRSTATPAILMTLLFFTTLPVMNWFIVGIVLFNRTNETDDWFPEINKVVDKIFHTADWVNRPFDDGE